VRSNLKSNNTSFTEQSLYDKLKRYVNAIRPLDWVLELFIGMEDIQLLERISGDLCQPGPGVASLPVCRADC
jgi:hypothetical protein